MFCDVLPLRIFICYEAEDWLRTAIYMVYKIDMACWYWRSCIGSSSGKTCWIGWLTGLANWLDWLYWLYWTGLADRAGKSEIMNESLAHWPTDSTNYKEMLSHLMIKAPTTRSWQGWQSWHDWQGWHGWQGWLSWHSWHGWKDWLGWQDWLTIAYIWQIWNYDPTHWLTDWPTHWQHQLQEDAIASKKW